MALAGRVPPAPGASLAGHVPREAGGERHVVDHVAPEQPARLLSLLLNLALLGTTAFGLFQTILVALIAPAWGRLAAATGK